MRIVNQYLSRIWAFFGTLQSSMESIRILGVTVHNISRTEVDAQLTAAMRENTQVSVCTPNPEILLYAFHHPTYRNTLNHFTLALPDGFGLKLLTPITHRVTGVWAAETLVRLANEDRKTICCIARADGRSTPNAIQQALQSRAPHATVHVIAHTRNAWKGSEAIQKIIAVQPDILLVGLGFPEQEQWIDTHLGKIPSARIALAVGGTFDFWTGAAQRAPQWMQHMGLEWLWRLSRQPKRIIRILNAVVRFPLTYWKHKND